MRQPGVLEEVLHDPAERYHDVAWDGHGKGTHEVAIQVLCADKPGLLGRLFGRR